ncbi:MULTISPECIES: hypothetical protein [unclassified Caulobacter]|uniref:hypothetical protein n=1 Tax=unclassified Caulobacter TaxID=2648921 RepID=UPI0006FA28F8|nr:MULTISPECIES: hypothetical protein [unclassified Caulobacter]KQV58912.1 hypothetical protein ASC62_06040 [Caulobacter sp. Root342]KQV69413.1 hypothetical protein ASC70_09995 [Caulobacter sp. Root343]
MTKTTQEAVEWLIDTVREALEDGRASESDLQDWLLAAIALEDMALEDQCDDQETRAFTTWISPSKMVH